MTDRFFLAAFEPLPKNWRYAVTRALTSGQRSCQKMGQNLFAYRDVAETKGITYADGTLLTRVWIGPRRWALGAQNRRLYFDQQTGLADRRPESEIVGDRRPPSPAVPEQIKEITEALETAGDGTMVPLQQVQLEQQDPPQISIKDKSLPAHAPLNAAYREHGFDDVPHEWTISVCPLEGAPLSAAATLKERLIFVARQRGAQLTVRIVEEAKVLEAADRIRNGDTPRPGRTVLFLLPRKQQTPAKQTIQLLDRLEQAKIRFRRAYVDDPIEFSVPDQLPSLLTASGGRPHKVDIQHRGQPVWSVGVDLSHRPEQPHSTLVTSLVDPTGLLVSAWSVSQPKNETPNAPALSRMLSAAAQSIRSSGGGNEPVLVIRDGRMFEGETGTLYEQAFEGPTTVIEYRKRLNPAVLAGQEPAPAPGAYLVPDHHTMFISTMPPKRQNSLPSVVKVTWKPSWNHAMFSPTNLADALVGLSLTPGLGLHPREKPAPIYWADGIAGVTPDDLRFAGNQTTQL